MQYATKQNVTQHSHTWQNDSWQNGIIQQINTQKDAICIYSLFEVWLHVILLSVISGMYYKCVTIVIYGHRDSGMYYKPEAVFLVVCDPSMNEL
jgi:hypothetical protein